MRSPAPMASWSASEAPAEASSAVPGSSITTRSRPSARMIGSWTPVGSTRSRMMPVNCCMSPALSANSASVILPSFRASSKGKDSTMRVPPCRSRPMRKGLVGACSRIEGRAMHRMATSSRSRIVVTLRPTFSSMNGGGERELGGAWEGGVVEGPWPEVAPGAELPDGARCPDQTSTASVSASLASAAFSEAFSAAASAALSAESCSRSRRTLSPRSSVTRVLLPMRSRM